MSCELCVRNDADYVAQEQGEPQRTVLMCENCLEQNKWFYKKPYWKLYAYKPEEKIRKGMLLTFTRSL